MIYAMMTWEKGDCVYEGIAIDGETRLYRFCCGLDQCPYQVAFGDQPMTETEVRDFLGADYLWDLLHDPATQNGGLRLDDESDWPEKYREARKEAGY